MRLLGFSATQFVLGERRENLLTPDFVNKSDVI
jgi:hypothetical protein